VLFHSRLVRPAVGLVLVLLGLGVILGNQNRHVIVNVGLCVAMCAAYYATIYASKYLGDQDFIAPVLAAWLPVLIFGPLVVVLLDAVHT
jgi:lipopolysaccharide export system permease protein